MNIYLREMKANRKALIIWSVCMFLLVVSGMSKYTAYSSGGATQNIFADMPRTLKVLMGIGDFNIVAMNGFYAFLFPYLELTAAIHAVLLGNGIILKEERDKTTEFLIVKPISRYIIITQKLLAALTNIAILNIVTLLSSILAVSAFNQGADITKEILILDLIMFLVQLLFLSLGAMLASILRKPKASASIGTGILLAGYVISKVTDLTDRLNALNLFSPFKYFDLVSISEGGGLNLWISLLTIVLAGAFVAATYYHYLKRDLNV